MKKLHAFGLVVGLLAMLGTSPAWSEVIDFDSQGLTGPSLFGGSAEHLVILTGIGNVAFDGGMILTNVTNLTVDTSSVYGTVSPAINGFSNPLTITFPSNISNFFLDMFNGNTIPVEYTVADNVGNSAMSTLAPNFNGGQIQIAFAAAGSVVTVQASTTNTNAFWDFFIDNIHFNEPLPNGGGAQVPEPSTMFLLGSGLIGLLGLRKKFKK